MRDDVMNDIEVGVRNAAFCVYLLHLVKHDVIVKRHLRIVARLCSTLSRFNRRLNNILEGPQRRFSRLDVFLFVASIQFKLHFLQ